MTSIRRTAYPRLKSHLTDQELEEIYQPTEDELHFVRINAKGDAQRLMLLLLLKCHQLLSHIPALELVPDNLRHYLCTQLQVPTDTSLTVDAEKTLYRYRQLIRTYLNVRSYSQGGTAIVESATQKAAYTMSDPADLINVAIEQLIHNRYELPAFSTLDRQVNHIRHQVHQALYTRVASQLNDEQRQVLDELLEIRVPPGRGQRYTCFTRMKEALGPATLKHLRRWEERLVCLDTLPNARLLLREVANPKIKQFATQAHTLEVGDKVNTRDQLVTMFLKRMRLTHNRAKDKLRELRDQQREMTEQMVNALAEIVVITGASFRAQGRKKLEEEVVIA